MEWRRILQMQLMRIQKHQTLGPFVRPFREDVHGAVEEWHFNSLKNDVSWTQNELKWCKYIQISSTPIQTIDALPTYHTYPNCVAVSAWFAASQPRVVWGKQEFLRDNEDGDMLVLSEPANKYKFDQVCNVRILCLVSCCINSSLQAGIWSCRCSCLADD